MQYWAQSHGIAPTPSELLDHIWNTQIQYSTVVGRVETHFFNEHHVCTTYVSEHNEIWISRGTAMDNDYVKLKLIWQICLKCMATLQQRQ